MTPEQLAAMEQALDCVSTLANARDWVRCTPNERWDEDEMYAELCNATICLKKSLSIIQEALAEQQSGIKQVIELYDSPEQPAQQDYWQEEARRYAQNAEFWRGKYEAATAQQQERCQHRWEESAFGKQYWEPGTHQYTCHRCGKMSMVQVGIDQGEQA